MLNRLSLPFEIYEINLLNATEKDLLKISSEMRLNLNINEMKAIKDYFMKKGRNPTDIELQTIGQLWSEHCRHKTFKGLIMDEKGNILVDNMLKNFIEKSTKEINASWVLSFLEDNAGIIDFTKEYAIAVKVETHNHPSAIDPFGGAATGVGGVIRDVLGVWAKPIALIDVLCFGPLDYPYEKLPKGIKHPRYIMRGVVAGIGYYGNNFGVPTIAGAIYFDEGYLGNVVVYAGCVGILPKSKYFRRIKPGDYILVIGNKTGKDGIHGATFASADLKEDSEISFRSAVQIPDPIEEEKLKRAILRIRDEELGSGITDLGGGGLAVAIAEMADKINGGATIWLNNLHLREKMSPWEIWISESQERMLLGVPQENIERVIKITNEEELECSIIGRFESEDRIKVYFNNYLIVDLETSFLLNPPKSIRMATYKYINYIEPNFPEPKDLNEVLLDLLASPNIASREKIIRTYDYEVQGNTVLKPLQEEYGGPNDASVIKPLKNSWKGLVISVGLKPQYSRIDTYWMAAASIEEALRNNIVVGGRRIAILDNFTWGNPESPDTLGPLVDAVKACYDFAKAFNTPFISGKDSLYNESLLGPVLPTLLITAIGVIPDIRKVISLDFKSPRNPIYMLGITRLELGASEYYRLKGFIGKSVPKVYVNESKKIMKCITKAIDKGYIKASHDLSEGGLGVALAEMSLSSNYGAEIQLSNIKREKEVKRNDLILFSESNGRFLLEVKRSKALEFEDLAKNLGCPYAKIGEVTSRKSLIIKGLNKETIINLSLNEMRKAWRNGLKW